MEGGKSIKKRLFHTSNSKSPKHSMFLEEDKVDGPILRPRKLQDGPATLNHAKSMPMFQQGKVKLGPVQGKYKLPERKPKEVEEKKLSRQARSMLQEGKHRVRSNLRPHDIFNLYDNYPEMLEDFFYLNRIEHPYDYKIVTYSQRNTNEYMTISSQGVTLYHDKEAEFLTRQEWLTDQKRYHALQNIYFFRQYKLCKNFRIWKNCMRRHYMRQMSTILKEHLFLTYRHPRSCLLVINKDIHILKESLSFFPYEQMYRLTPEAFKTLMADYRQQTLVTGIAGITERITESLQQAVMQEINHFKVENKIEIEGLTDKKATNKEGYIYSQEAILRKEYRRVYKLIKLADEMLQQAKIQMVSRCLEQLIAKIDELRSEEREPWITCSAAVSADGAISWQPDCPTLADLFLEAIRDNVQCLSRHNDRIINHPNFDKYRQAQVGEPHLEDGSFKALIQSSSNYLPLLDRIEDKLAEEFSSTAEEEAQLHKYIQIYLRHQEQADMSRIFEENGAVDLCQLVEEWKNDEKEMHSLPQDRRGKLLLYNYAVLRKKIINSPKETLSTFFGLLPEQTKARCVQLTTEAKSLLDMITVYPTEIFSFAAYTRAVRNASQRLEDIRGAGSEICLLIDLMSKNKLGNLEFYNSRKIEALNSIAALKGKVEESEAKENQSLSKFKKDNEVEVGRIKVSVKELSGRFNAVDFNQIKVTNKEMKETLTSIRDILPSINALEQQSQRIQEVQQQLNLTESNFREVHQLHRSATLVHQIWTCRDEWKTMLVTLYHQHYTQVDYLGVKQQWEDFSNQVASLTKALPDNQILKNLTQQLSEVEVLVEVIAALRSPNLEEKSWKEISEYLGYELGLDSEAELPFANINNPSYTVKWLLEINIPVYKQKIEFIVRKSQKEKELVQNLSEFKNFLVNLSLEMAPRKREVYVLEPNSQIQDKIHANLAMLYAMLGSHYSPAIKNEAETLIRHHEYIEQIIQASLEFGQEWEKYQSFFEGNTASKMLNKQNKEFTNWEGQWKKILKSITNDSALFYKRVCDETTGINCSRSTMKQINKLHSAIEQVKRGLEEYLDKKRASFPRYYFVHDQQLLHMLATADPAKEPVNQAFVPIVYRHIDRILYKEDTKDTLLGIVGKNGEDFPLKPANFKLGSEMEEVFKVAEEQIRKRMGNLIRTVFAKYVEEQITRSQMMEENNLQVALVIDLVAWGRLGQETYLCPEPVGDLYDWINVQMAQIKELKGLMNQPHAPHATYKLMQLMSQSLYLRQKTQNLLKSNVSTIECYEWERVPKMWMSQTNGQVFLRLLNSRVAYCYEFLGNGTIGLILPETQRAWVNLTQSLTNKDTVLLRGSHRVETIRELGFVVGQDLDHVHLSEEASYRHVEQFIAASNFTGNWLCLDLSHSPQILSFLAYQLVQLKKNLAQTTFDKNKSAVMNNSNSAFFLLPHPDNSSYPTFSSLLQPLQYRDLTLSQPNLSKIYGMIGQCQCESSEIGTKSFELCQIVKQCFEDSFYSLFNHQFVIKVIERVKNTISTYQWLQNLKCKDFLQYVIFDSIDHYLLPPLRKDDQFLYEQIKQAVVTDYDKLRVRNPQYTKDSDHSTEAFLIDNKCQFMLSPEFLTQFEHLVSTLTSMHLGVVITGESLSGKSTLLNLAARFIEQKEKPIRLKRVYHQAYSASEVYGFSKNPSILSQIFNEPEHQTWIVMDGQISEEYARLLGGRAEKFVIPQVGAVSTQDSIKFIQQTCDSSNISPSLIGNHALVCLSDLTKTQTIVRGLFKRLQSHNYMSCLNQDTVEELIRGLISTISKVESKATLKSKSINLIYSLTPQEIAHRCCRVVEAIFTMNWQSVREREKGMRKLVQRFVAWTVYWGMVGLVPIEDEPKLDKFISELSSSAEQWGSCIIYPGCGFEVQPINGLRTQSTLNIPEKGIITNSLRSDLLGEADPQKGNKFYEEIVISEARLIRVNCKESTKLSYVAQLSSFTHTPVLLLGPANSGRKTLCQIYAKNMRQRTQFYPIRYHSRLRLPVQLERPFKKVNGFEGAIMRTASASKKLLISIEDLHLGETEKQSGQFLRMLVNESGYHMGCSGQWVKLENYHLMMLGRKVSLNSQTLRLLPALNVFQTTPNSEEKLRDIYEPYLKNWAIFNGMTGDIQKIFAGECSQTILDATLGIYKYMQDISSEQAQPHSLIQILSRPTIGDVAKVLNYICRTPDANHYNMTYFYELWVHQIVRVFGDRLQDKWLDGLFGQIKKESLIKFKQNFTCTASTMFSFSSLGIENQNCYIRIQDPAYLHTYISNLLEADQINLPLKYLFDELLQYVLQFYRIMANQGGHLLVLSHNVTTGAYLVRLACQIGQQDWYPLGTQGVSAQKHIEPTLYYKDQIVLSQEISKLSVEDIYQISCLLNYNYYDFNLTPQLKEKIRGDLNRKEKTDLTKTESKVGKGKVASEKAQQPKEEDIESLMSEQFMNYCHFFMYSSPVGKGLHEFLSHPDIFGNLHFSWVDIPTESAVKVAKQILTFEQENGQSMIESYSDDLLIKKVKTIYNALPQSHCYFNDMLTICEMAKMEGSRIGKTLTQRMEKLKQGRENMDKVRALITSKNEAMDQIKAQLDQLNTQLEKQAQDLEEISSQIAQIQMAGEELGQDFNELAFKKEEIEVGLKLGKEKKENLESQKKRISKSIKIGNDYFDTFQQSSQFFDERISDTQSSIDLLQDKLVMVWSALCYLTNKPPTEWIETINSWVTLIESKLPQLTTVNEVLQLIESVSALPLNRWDIFSPALRVKALGFMLLLHNYEETNLYGHIPRVYDPQSILPLLLRQMAQCSNAFNLLKTFKKYSPELRGQFESLLKLKNGVVIIESSKNISDLEIFLQDRKLGGLLHKVIVLAGPGEEVDITLEADEEQIQKNVQQFILQRVNPGVVNEQSGFFNDLAKQNKRKQENQDFLLMACADINLQTETYTEQINKYRDNLTNIGYATKMLMDKASAKKYLEMNEFEVMEWCWQALKDTWLSGTVSESELAFVYEQALRIRFSAEYQQWEEEKKKDLLNRLTMVNVGHSDHFQMNYFEYRQCVRRISQDKIQLILLPPTPASLTQLQRYQHFKVINLLTVTNAFGLFDEITADIPKVFYNFNPQLHSTLLRDLIERMAAIEEAENCSSITIMTTRQQLPELGNERVTFVELELPEVETEEEQHISQMKGLCCLQQFISIYDKENQNLATIFSYFQDHVDLVKSDEDMAKLVHDFYEEIPETTLNYLIKLPETQLKALTAKFSSDKNVPKMDRRTSLLPHQSQEQAPSGRDQCPFTFNTHEFPPSKDLMAHQLIAICGLFNYKVNQTRLKMKESHYEWEENNQVVIPTKDIAKLNFQASLIKRNLGRLHLTPPSLTKGTSHQIMSHHNLHLGNLTKLPIEYITTRILHILRAKAVKRLKKSWGSIKIIWKLASQGLSLEEMGSHSELAISLEGTLQNGQVLESLWTNTPMKRHIDMVVFASQGIHEPPHKLAVEHKSSGFEHKPAPTMIPVPVKLRGRTLGQLEFSSSELSGDYHAGIDKPYIELQEPVF